MVTRPNYGSSTWRVNSLHCKVHALLSLFFTLLVAVADISAAVPVALNFDLLDVRLMGFILAGGGGDVASLAFPLLLPRTGAMLALELSAPVLSIFSRLVLCVRLDEDGFCSILFEELFNVLSERNES